VLRVVAYATVMPPAYPPLRVDRGEQDPGGKVTVEPVTSALSAPESAASNGSS
jgi:hypothetical protein